MKPINEIKKEIEKLEIILKRTPISTEKFREAMKKQQIKKAQLQTSQDIYDWIIEKWEKGDLYRCVNCRSLHKELKKSLGGKNEQRTRKIKGNWKFNRKRN